MNTILEEGQIKHMQLPDGWADDATQENKLGFIRSFKSPDCDKVQICHFTKHQLLSLQSNPIFVSLLAMPPHILDEAEWSSIALATYPAGNKRVFDLKESRTETLNGKTVLIIEGFWKEPKLHTYKIVSSMERQVEKVYFEAPPEAFFRFLPLVQEAFNTIVWQPEVQYQTLPGSWDFNDEAKFPAASTVIAITKLLDDSLEVKTFAPANKRTKFQCPPGSKMYEYLLSLCGGNLPRGMKYVHIAEMEFC